MLNLERLTDTSNPRSLSNRLRSRRFRFFERLLNPFPRPVRILDVGGTVEFWEQRGWAGNPDYRIVLVNLSAAESPYDNLQAVPGDATDLKDCSEGEFDVAFSNSVIEHLFTFENQQAMAREIRRVAAAYWVQTPNYWFPIEPHFHFPGWQWLPEGVRVRVLMKRRCGRRGPCATREEARELVREVRLLTKRELRRLFPDGTLWPERIGGIVKSWVVYGGFPEPDR